MSQRPAFRLLRFLLGWTLLATAAAAEVDSFTHRHPLADAGPFLDQVVNVWMEEAVIEANQTSLLSELFHERGCDAERLMDALESKLAGYLVGQLETFADHSTWLDTIHTPFQQSIYRDLDFSESPTVVLTERLASLLRIGDVYLGSDKLGHFFTEGHTYFERYRDEGEQSALDYGKLMESSLYGELTTGVFSYADLAANLNGLRFWNAILGRQADPLQPLVPVRPYIGCRQGRWQRLREFHWADYVDPAWDEALNCNVYADEAHQNKVLRRIDEATGGRGCPLHPVDRQALARKYGRLLPLVFNDAGPRAVHSFDHLIHRYWNEILERWETLKENAHKPVLAFKSRSRTTPLAASME